MSSSTPRSLACASTASMVFTSSRAASTLSSTATRAAGPMASLTKSMLSACSSGRSYGWSYETLASRTSNHSGPLLPRPRIFTCWAIIVHIRWALPVRSAQRPVGEGEELLPAVHGLLLPVGRAVVVEEAVARAVVAMELVLLAVLLELRLVLIDLLGRRRLVLVAEEPEDRGREVLGVLDGRHGLVRGQLRLGHDDAAAPALDDCVEALQLAAGEESLPPARARAEHADPPRDVR